jgi:hypothetical protein
VRRRIDRIRAHFCLWRPIICSGSRLRTKLVHGRTYVESVMSFQAQSTVALGVLIFGGAIAMADTLQTHRIPAALATEAASETIAACAKQGYRETAVVLDADGAVITVVRGDGAGIHTRSIAPMTKRTRACPSRTIRLPWLSVPKARTRLLRSPSYRTSCSSAVGQ